tara:strand:+ start:232 stop:420 length:189 start_codon:yes stop_codon:yes gene_type:complete
MKPKKEVTEEDLQLLERHIQTTKLRLIDTQNQFAKSMGRMRGSLILISILLIIGMLTGYLLT